MTQITGSPQTLSRTVKGSRPFAEVLSRIQVRDPQHKPSGIYDEGLADFESHSPKLQMTALLAVSALFMGSLFSISFRQFAQTWNENLFHSSVATPSQPLQDLIIPKAIHILPRVVRRPPDERTLDAVGMPENLHARFMGPRELELRWDSLGDGYVYRLYVADNSTMQNAQPVSEHLVQATNMAWTPDDGVHTVWVAVKGISDQGRETPFSRPLLVRLPNP